MRPHLVLIIKFYLYNQGFAIVEFIKHDSVKEIIKIFN